MRRTISSRNTTYMGVGTFRCVLLCPRVSTLACELQKNIPVQCKWVPKLARLVRGEDALIDGALGVCEAPVGWEAAGDVAAAAPENRCPLCARTGLFRFNTARQTSTHISTSRSMVL